MLLAVAALAPAPARPADRDNCLLCHQFRGLGRYDAERDRLHVYFVDPDYVHELRGPHARLACTDCHERTAVMDIPHAAVGPVDCAQVCHLSDPVGLERRFSHANVAQMLENSVHTSAVLARTRFAAGPLLAEGQAQCLYCHDEPLFRNPQAVSTAWGAPGGRAFDRCNMCHAETVPVDIRYYVRHIAARLQPARSTLEQAQACAVCHSDPQMRQDTGLPDAVASYVRSFHGKAALLGDETTASCVSCHVAAGANAHLMLGPQNPGSSVYPTRIAESCRSTACHPGSDPKLARTAVHLDLQSLRGTVEYALAAAFVALTILTFGPSAVLVLLELFHILAGRHHHGRREMRELTLAVLRHPDGRRRLQRFTGNQRIQHWGLVILFALLALTGFPLKFADRAWAAAVIDWFGGLHTARLMHHWAGIALILGFAAHMVYAGWTMRAPRRQARAHGAGARPGLVRSIAALPMWIGWSDARKAVQLLAYLLLLRREPPTFGRFTVKEKFEYIGVFWGTTLLGLTGLVLWGEQLSTRLFSGRWLNLALIAHTYEAFLAIIHVGILHIVNVILAPNVFPLSPATLTGQTPVAELAEGHGELVAEVARELGVAAPPAVATGGSHV